MSASAIEDWAVIFVHGVGATKTEQMRTDAANAIDVVRQGFATVRSSDSVKLRSGQQTRITTSSVGPCTVRTAEVFWGDISRVHKQRLGVVASAVFAVLRLPQVITAALKVEHALSRPIAFLLAIATGLLRFAVMPLAIVAAGLGVFGFALKTANFDVDTANTRDAAVLVAIASSLMAVVAFACWRVLKRAVRGWEIAVPIALAVFVCSLGMLFAAVIDGWVSPGQISSMPCTPQGCYNPARDAIGKPYGLLIAANIKTQDIAFDVVLIATSIAVLLVTLAQYAGSEPAAVRSLRIAVVAAITFFTFYFLLTKPIDMLAGLYLGSAKSLNLYWYDMVVFVFLLVVFCIILLALRQRRQWVGALPADRSEASPNAYDEERPLRLILPRPYEAATFTLVLFTTIFAIAVEASKFRGEGSDPFINPTSIPSWTLSVLVVGAVLLMVALSPTLRVALAIVTDVIDHFVVSRQGTSIAKLRSDRLGEVVDQLLEKQPRANLLVVAHSQGTMIVVDALRDARRVGKWQNIGQLRFLSVGSPIQHIYQRYFSHLYPNTLWQELSSAPFATRFDWVNLYRPDDYVGRKVVGVAADLPANVEFPKTGGHTRYWEAEVIEYLDARKPDFFLGLTAKALAEHAALRKEVG